MMIARVGNVVQLVGTNAAENALYNHSIRTLYMAFLLVLTDGYKYGK